jgi:hypothetical protein
MGEETHGKAGYQMAAKQFQADPDDGPHQDERGVKSMEGNASEPDKDCQVDAEIDGKGDPAGVEGGVREANAFEHEQPMERAGKPQSEVRPSAGEHWQPSEPEPGQGGEPSQPREIERWKGCPKKEGAGDP